MEIDIRDTAPKAHRPTREIISSIAQAFVMLTFFTLSYTKGNLRPLDTGASPWQTTLTFVGLLVGIRWIRERRGELRMVDRLLLGLLSVFFSVTSLVGATYEHADKSCLTLWLSSISNIISAALFLIGGCLLFWYAFRLVGIALSAFSQTQVDERGGVWGKLCSFLTDGHRSLKQTLVLLLVWGPQVAIRYPGCMVVDSCYSLSQFLGMNPWTSKHPPLYAFFVGIPIKFGESLGNGEWGLFALVILQLLIAIAMVVYTLHVLDLVGVPAIFQSLCFVLAAFTPLVVSYVPVVLKDFEFCVAFVFLMDELMLYLMRPDHSRPSHIPIVLLSVVGLFFRRNGVYVIAAVLFFLILRALFLAIRDRSLADHGGLTFLLSLSLSFGLCYVGTKVLDRVLNVQQSYSRVIYSLPMQQVGHYMSIYGDSLDAAELKTLREVVDLDVDEYAEHYNPLSFDGIKLYFDNSSSGSERMAFLKLWISLLQRHPATCIDATLIQNYRLFSPLEIDFHVYESSGKSLVRTASEYSYDLSDYLSDSKTLSKMRSRVTKLYSAMTAVPVVGLALQMSLYMIAFLYCFIVSIRPKAFNRLILMLSPLLILGFTFVGPTIAGHVRYVFPVMWSAPLWMGACISSNRTDPEGA